MTSSSEGPGGADAWGILAHLWQLMQSVLDESAPALEAIGLTPKALFLLAAVEEHPFPAELARLMHLPPPTVTYMVKQMEAGGFLERRAEPGDLRKFRLVVTDDGRRAIARGPRGDRDRSFAGGWRGSTPEEIGRVRPARGAAGRPARAIEGSATRTSIEGRAHGTVLDAEGPGRRGASAHRRRSTHEEAQGQSRRRDGRLPGDRPGHRRAAGRGRGPGLRQLPGERRGGGRGRQGDRGGRRRGVRAPGRRRLGRADRPVLRGARRRADGPSGRPPLRHPGEQRGHRPRSGRGTRPPRPSSTGSSRPTSRGRSSPSSTPPPDQGRRADHQRLVEPLAPPDAEASWPTA